MFINQPMFISVEGTEGAGKTTMVAHIVESLKRYTPKVVATKAPGGTVIGDKLRTILKSDFGREELTDYSRVMLLLTDRLQQIKYVITPQLEEGVSIVTDRYLDSAEVLQCRFGGSTQLYRAICEAPGMEALSIRPDYTFFFTASHATCHERVKSRQALNSTGSGPTVDDILDEMYSRRNVSELWKKYFDELSTTSAGSCIFTIDTDTPNGMSVEQSIQRVKDKIDSIVDLMASEWHYSENCFYNLYRKVT